MTLLSLRDISHRYPMSDSVLPVLNHVGMDVEDDAVVSIVGESGCGKTSLGRVAIGLVQPLAGEVLYEGKDVWSLSRDDWNRYRRSVQVVHQDPYASLNPGLSVAGTLQPGLQHHRIVPRRDLRREMLRLLDLVGLDTTEAFLHRYPHQLSGGQRQRLAIARAVSLRPRLVVADEAVSMLDVSMRISVLDLLHRLREEQQLAYIFISHDFGVVRYFTRGGRIMVMFFGVVVEEGPSEEVIRRPRHPYSFLLLDAIPVPDPRLARRRRTEETKRAEDRIERPPSPVGCIFANRCPYVEDICRKKRPKLVELAAGHRAACHFPERVPELAITQAEAAG